MMLGRGKPSMSLQQRWAQVQWKLSAAVAQRAKKSFNLDKKPLVSETLVCL
jgi:hypothetical protein